MGVIIESGCVEVLYASLLLFWITYLYFVKHYGYWEERRIPHIPPVFPFGSVKEIIPKSTCSAVKLDEIYKEFKEERYVGFVSIRTPSIIIKDPELIRLILTKNFNNFTDHADISGHHKEYIMKNVYFLKGQKWKYMRLKLSPAYTAAKMKMMFFLVKQCSDVLRKVVERYTEENNVVDVRDVLSRYIIDVIAICAFGVESNSLSSSNSEFFTMAMKSTEINKFVMLKTFLYSSFPAIFEKYYCINLVDRSITKFFTGVIRSAIEFRKKHNISKFDFLDLLIKLRQNQSILEDGEKPMNSETTSSCRREVLWKAIRYKMGTYAGETFRDMYKFGIPGMTIEEITAETFLFLLAGFETTTSTITFCLYELACNIKIQDKLYCEVQETLDRHNGELSYVALQEMSYMDQVISECLRHYPPFSFLTRKCTQDFAVPNSNLVIEKGIELFLPIYSLHHDPKYFTDPNTFSPERFSKDNVKKQQHPFVYLPFGEGPRICLGQKYGLMNVKTALATLIMDYHFSITSDTDVPINFKSISFALSPSKPLMIIFNRRNSTI